MASRTAIHVPAGTHEVRLVYAPREWRAGMVISAVASLVTVALAVLAAWTVRRAR